MEEKEKVIEIEIERLRDFKEHPFHVKDVFYGDTLFYSYKFTAKYRNRYWLRVSFMVVFNIINHSHTAAIITAVQIIRRSCSRWFFNSLLA